MTPRISGGQTCFAWQRCSRRSASIGSSSSLRGTRIGSWFMRSSNRGSAGDNAAAMPARDLTVSVVINTYNRAASLDATLRSLRRLNYPRFEVIVVNGPSTDSTMDVLRAHAPSIRVGTCSDRNLSVSRNVGIDMARGNLVAFLDDDAVPDENWLNDAVDAFDSEEV